MKKLILCLFAVSVFTFNSCSSDDDNTSNVSVEGTWKLTAWNSAVGYDINNDGTASTNILEELNCYENETLVINSNNTAVANSTSYADITAELIVGTTNEYVYSVDCIDELGTFPLTWTVIGNSIIFDEGTEDEVTGTVNGNQISIVIPEGLYIYNEDSFEAVVNQDLIFVYTKQ